MCIYLLKILKILKYLIKNIKIFIKNIKYPPFLTTLQRLVFVFFLINSLFADKTVKG